MYARSVNEENGMVMMSTIEMMSDDFDQWFDDMVELARNDPQAFEDLRKRMVDEVIDEAPEENRRRLVGLQWRVDQERKLAKNPLAACIRISDLMWDSVTGDGGLLEHLNRVSALRR